MAYPRHSTRPQTFVAPPQGQAQLCAVKILSKQVVQDRVAQGSHENPLCEMCRYETLGDNEHVLKPMEMLQDNDHWFIITPLGVSFDKICYHKPPLPLSKARTYFTKMLRILRYLQDHDIHARDVKPENFVLLPNGTLVLMDLAMSCQIPRNSAGQPFRLKNMGTFGTAAYLAPELLYQRPTFDGTAADVWAVVLILYIMVTGRRLYHLPTASDLHYVWFCLRRGFAASPQTTKACLGKLAPTLRAKLVPTLQRHERLFLSNASLRELLAHSLCHNPAQRWTLAQLMACDFVTEAKEA